ncbi:MAG TPA: hypothetical protein VNN17_07230 [Terriglobia bacterium]|nr:hypothetical protein [Terriglobia bacterium]
MKRNLRDWTGILMGIVAFALAAAAQQPQATGTSTTVKGTITSVAPTPAGSVAIFTLKTAEGKEYMVHLGRLTNAAGQLFAPKTGDAITLTGQPLGETGTMLHATQITLGTQTYRASPGPGPGPAAGPGMQGMMGPGMHGMMGMMQNQGPGPQGQGMPAPAMSGMMCGCPCMGGQPMQGPPMANPAPPAAGMCPGCTMQHNMPAPSPAPQ